MKICSKCSEPKDVSEFCKHSQTKDGLRSQCKACEAAYRAAHREEIAAYGAQWYKDHRKEMLQRNAQWKKDNREERADYNAQWRKDNPDKVRAQKHRRRARKQGNGGTHTSADIQRAGDSQNWVCWWRGPGCTVYCRDKYHVDHLIPIARGGHNDPSNIVISCPHCNDSKGAKTPDEFCGRLL